MGDKRLGLKCSFRKGMKLAGLGITVWLLSLFWPEVNHFLTETMMIKMILGLGVISLVYVLHQSLGWPHNHHKTRQQKPSNSRPNNLAPSVSKEGGWRWKLNLKH